MKSEEQFVVYQPCWSQEYRPRQNSHLKLYLEEKKLCVRDNVDELY